MTDRKAALEAFRQIANIYMVATYAMSDEASLGAKDRVNLVFAALEAPEIDGLEDAVIKPGELLPGVSNKAGWVSITMDRLYKLNDGARAYLKLTRGIA